MNDIMILISSFELEYTFIGNDTIDKLPLFCALIWFLNENMLYYAYLSIYMYVTNLQEDLT